MVAVRPYLVRFGAPVAFLAAATLAILAVRSTAFDAQPTAQPTQARSERAHATPAARRPARPRTAAARQEHYEIRAGDTLGAVADRYDTTVETLVGLNPGIDPTALQVGRRIRVK